MIRNAIASILLIVLVSTAWAEDPQPSPSPKSRSQLSKSQHKMVELLELERDLLETGTLSPKRRDRLIVVYEKLTEILCMPHLQTTLDYEGHPEEPECVSALTKLKQFHPENPIARCAEHGIDSQICKTSYEDQYIGTFSASASSGASDVDLEAKLNALRTGEDVYKIRSSTRELMRELRESDGNVGDKPQRITENLFKLLRLGCEYIRVVIVHDPPADYLKANYSDASKKSESLRNLVNDYEEARKKKKVQADPFKLNDPSGEFRTKPSPSASPIVGDYRIRQLSSACSDSIETALEFDSRFGMAICYREGFTSPNCIFTRRSNQKLELEAQRKQKGGTPQGNTNQGGGFSTF